MKWSLREILRRDCVARFASHCPETSEVVHPRLFFNNRTESLPVKQFRWLSVRDVILTVVVTATFVTFSNNVFGQDGLIPLRLLTDSESSSAQPTSLAAEFADRLEKNQIKAEHEKYTTSLPGVFAAGDCRRGQSLVVWAFNEGRGAARECDRFLMGETALP